MVTFIVRLMFVVIGVAVAYIIWMIYMKNRTKPKQTPQDRMDGLVEKQHEKLFLAKEALATSETYLRRLKRGVDKTKADISELNTRIEKAVKGDNDGTARTYLAKLSAKEKELEGEMERLKVAKERHDQNISVITAYQNRIDSLQHEAKDLQVRLGLAKTEKDAAALMADLESNLSDTGYGSAKYEIETEINQARAEADIDAKLARGPETEFSQEEDDVEDRLAALKTKLKTQGE